MEQRSRQTSKSQLCFKAPRHSVSFVKRRFYKIGVDGGGTKTECILIDARGAVAARHTAAACNPSLVGSEMARKILADALQTLWAQIRHSGAEISATLLCMAGSLPFWREAAAGIKDYGTVTAAPDSLPVLELATGGAPGLVLHAGTGSFVAARAPDGSIHYAGGLGWRFGDPGSGHDLGRRAIARALLELQGWTAAAGDWKPDSGRRSPLAQALCEFTALDGYAAISRLFYSAAEANVKIAAFAPRVVELAERGCKPAQEIIAESLAEYAVLVNRVLASLFPAAGGRDPQSSVPCGVSGTLLNRPPCLRTLQALAATQAWPVRLQPIADLPIEGVRRLLLKRD
jgi:N-acetylglucosamine kinase-like BadF-type ATPase